MIGKAHSGAGFGGLTRYLLTGRKDEPNPDRVLWTSTRELALDEPRQAAMVMRATASQGRTDKPTQHLSISLAPHEHLSREQWEKVVDTTLRDLGLEGHQALVVAHQDTSHEHIHIVVNRVHPETHLAWDRWQDRPRLMASLRLQEVALGLRQTPHVKDSDRLPDELVQQFERTGEPPLLDFARGAARPAFQEAGSWSELHERLAEQGLYLERKGQGLVVSDDQRQVKASSVDRSASLGALEARLGPYEERGPLLQEVDQALRSQARKHELTMELFPLNQLRQQWSVAASARNGAAQRLEGSAAAIRAVAAKAFRDPAEAAGRYLRRLDAGGPSRFQPAELGPLRGFYLRTGRNYLPLGAEGNRAFRIAMEEMLQLGAAYQATRQNLAGEETRLSELGRQVEQLEERYKPQLEELARLSERFPSTDLTRDVLSLRPRDQIALARAHGPRILERAAERSPTAAGRTAAAREWWMQNLAPQLVRVLDRQLAQRGIPAPTPEDSPARWMANAVRRGLRLAHAAQALARADVPLADTVEAASRTLSAARHAAANPAKAAVKVTAKALGVPALPLRLAELAWSVAERVGRALSR